LENEKLVLGGEGTRLTVEYKNVFYNMADQEAMRLFLAYPDKYNRSELPPLPRLLDASEISPDEVQLKGYCAVTLFDGPEGYVRVVLFVRFSSIVHGDISLGAEYMGKTFVFVDEAKADRFMKTPWKYAGVVLPRELPPVKVYIPLKNLPIVGYLEETLSCKINEGLQELSKFKPKYPYKTLDDSARLFLGLYLKGRKFFNCRE
jgi:hypothetical protein